MKYAPLLISSGIFIFLFYSGYNMLIGLGIVLIEYSIFDFGIKMNK